MTTILIAIPLPSQMVQLIEPRFSRQSESHVLFLFDFFPQLFSLKQPIWPLRKHRFLFIFLQQTDPLPFHKNYMMTFQMPLWKTKNTKHIPSFSYLSFVVIFHLHTPYAFLLHTLSYLLCLTYLIEFLSHWSPMVPPRISILRALPHPPNRIPIQWRFKTLYFFFHLVHDRISILCVIRYLILLFFVSHMW